MNEQAREKLNSVLLKQGRGLINDRTAAESLLQRELADTPREQGLILTALRANIPADLLKNAVEPMDARLEALTRRLSEGHYLQPEPARWSVETWAVALGILTPQQCELYRSAGKGKVAPAFGPSQMSRKPIIDTATDLDSSRSTQTPLSPASETDMALKYVPAGAFDIPSSTPPGSAVGFVPNPLPVPSLSAQGPSALPASNTRSDAALIPPPHIPNVQPTRMVGPSPAPRTISPLMRRLSSGVVPWSLLGVGVLAGAYFFIHRPAQVPVERHDPPVIVNRNPSANPLPATPPQSAAPSAAPPEASQNRLSPSRTLPSLSPSDHAAAIPPSVSPYRSKAPSSAPSVAPAPPAPPDKSLNSSTNSLGSGEKTATNDEPPGSALPPVVSLSESDLAGKSARELNILRNEPYARHGYRFRAPRLLSYFLLKPWYHAVFANPAKAWNRMSETERHNVQLILDYQKQRGMILETENESSFATPIDTLMQQVSQRAVTPADLSGKTRWELKLLRNMPYAQHGYRFKDPALREYFLQKPWYRPFSGDPAVVEALMTRLERRNAEFIRIYQQRHPQ